MMNLLTAAAILAVASEPSPQSAPGHETQEVVVTAPLRTDAEKALQGVSVLTETELLALPSATLGEALEKLPGVTSTAFGAGAARPVIRGLGEDRIRILSNGIGVIDASSASPDHAVSADASEATRIEVLRGSQALAYGNNAIGGVVNVIDGLIKQERPDKVPGGGARFNYSTVDDGFQGAGHVDLAYGPVAIRIQGGTRETDDYDIPGNSRSRVLREASGEEDRETGRLANSDVDASNYAFGLSLLGTGRSLGVTYRRLTGNYGVPGEGEEGPRIDLAQNRVEVRGETLLGLAGLESGKFSFAYGDYQHVELEGGVEPATLFFNRGYEFRAELAHQPVLGAKGAFGFQFLRSDNGAIGEESFIAPNIQRDIGGFWLGRREFGALSLEAGARIDSRRIAPDSGPARGFTPASFSFGGAWQASETLLLGLTFARAQRAPNPAELFALGPHLATANFELGDADIGIETGNSFEFATHWHFSRLKVDLHGFHTRFNNFIALTPDGRSAQDLVDAGLFPAFEGEEAEEFGELPVFAFNQRDARFTGGEIEIVYEILHRGTWHLTTDASVELVRARFAAREGAGTNRNLPRIPPLNVVLGLKSEWRGLTARVEGIIARGQSNVTDFELPTDGYRFLNAQLIWQPRKNSPVTLVIDGRNLTDADARLATSFLKDVAPLPGRNIRFTLKAAF